jgi:hypothetical protein
MRHMGEGGFRVTAIVAAYNEADVIGQVLADLIAQGLSVYLIDDGSTDGTVARATPFLGQGLLQIERRSSSDRFQWGQILRRKEELAQELDASWFLHADADELRESPWADHRLAEAIERVDRAGYNAIDFQLFNFWPTHERFAAGEDLRQAFSHYQPGSWFDRLQIKCWKKQPQRVDLASSGGHEVVFAGRQVFPIKFLLRHYPLRSQAHAERKIFEERQPRFAKEEEARGWHVQYRGLRAGQDFLRAPEELLAFDLPAARDQVFVRNRLVEELEEELVRVRAERDARTLALARSQDEVAQLRAELDARGREVLELRAQNADQLADLVRVRAAVEEAARECTALSGRLDAEHVERMSILNSRAWRWTGPARMAWRLLGRR